MFKRKQITKQRRKPWSLVIGENALFTIVVGLDREAFHVEFSRQPQSTRPATISSIAIHIVPLRINAGSFKETNIHIRSDAIPVTGPFLSCDDCNVLPQAYLQVL